MEKQIIKFEHKNYEQSTRISMPFSILTADKFNTQKWSGGTSTQLYIYPKYADYKQKNFNFRLSTAKVAVKQSDFTPLDGVSRKIMILEGEIEISHKNQHSKKLHKFDVDAFEGSWETSSIGTCVDFNLMTRGNTQGELSSITLEKDKTLEYSITRLSTKLFIYLYSGKMSFVHKESEHTLNKGELLIIDQVDQIKFNALQYSELVISEIY